jgi:hypothetical protein
VCRVCVYFSLRLPDHYRNHYYSQSSTTCLVVNAHMFMKEIYLTYMTSSHPGTMGILWNKYVISRRPKSKHDVLFFEICSDVFFCVVSRCPSARCQQSAFLFSPRSCNIILEVLILVVAADSGRPPQPAIAGETISSGQRAEECEFGTSKVKVS